jgi:hypothetical protein
MTRLEWAGVTFAIRASDISALAEQPGGEALVRDYFRDLGPAALEHLRESVGGIPLRSEPIVRIDGPQDDALQGPIYALSVSAQVDVDDLPVGSTMRAAYDRHGVLTTEPGFIL